MNVKVIFLVVVFSILAASQASANSPPALQPAALTSADMDGIWAIQNPSVSQQQVASYFSIRATADGVLVIIRLGSYDWQAFVSTLTGTSATIITMTSQAINSWRIDFASAQQATITGVLCISNGGGILPMVPSPTVGAAPATDVVGTPIRVGNNCFIPQGTVLNLSKII